MKKSRKPKRSYVEQLLADHRRNPSAKSRDARQLDLIDHVANKQKREGFTALDAAIAEKLGEEPPSA